MNESCFEIINVLYCLGLNKVYGCVVSREDHLVRKDGGGFDPEDYDSHPELYTSTFAKQVRSSKFLFSAC